MQAITDHEKWSTTGEGGFLINVVLDGKVEISSEEGGIWKVPGNVLRADIKLYTPVG